MAENHSISSVDFVFADNNCHMTMRTKSGRFHYFNSNFQRMFTLTTKSGWSSELSEKPSVTLLSYLFKFA